MDKNIVDDRLKIFISYSHEDMPWIERLRVHLKPFERGDILTYWDDGRIVSGSLWEQVIIRELETSDVGILLVSADFLASEYISKVELPRLLEASLSVGGHPKCAGYGHF
jgi:hypothetical protein